MDASSRTFPDFITQSLPDLVKPRKTLTDLDQDENRGVFWLKIIRELAPKIGISTENLHLIHQILTARAIASFLSRLSDKSITYEKPLYGNALPFIDIDEPMAWCIFIDEMGNHVDARTGQITEQLKIVTDPSEIEKWYSQNLATRGTIVRPRYLTMIEHPYLPNGAIELYGAAVRKDVDVLRNQLKEFSGNSYTSDQINAHVQTIRNRLQGIPRVLWGSTDLITETVAKAKEACQNASISTEKVTINILRSVVIDYLMSNYEDPFVIGALHGFVTYSQRANSDASVPIPQLDYAIEWGQKALTKPVVVESKSFNHLDKPGVLEYMKQKHKELTRSLG
ncbi:unnamed protein product [Rotaria sp. Silwood2]|nr:unnamed protein product [Rotaria sp. Silwood2]